MGITNEESTEYTQVYITTPPSQLNTTELHGRMRIAFFTHDQSAAGDAASDVVLVKLPPGRVRLLLGLSRAYINWTTGSATPHLGWGAFPARGGTTPAGGPTP